jgi:hypothetical protein
MENPSAQRKAIVGQRLTRVGLTTDRLHPRSALTCRNWGSLNTELYRPGSSPPPHLALRVFLTYSRIRFRADDIREAIYDAT